MNKYILLSFVFLIIVYSSVIIYRQEKLSQTISNPEYQNYIDEYKKDVAKHTEALLDSQDKLTEYNLNYKSSQSNDGTTGNFEGPQVHLKALKFCNEDLNKEDSRLLHFDGVSAHFDPDHPCMGLPDVEINIQDVRLYSQEKNSVSQFLNFGSKTEPQPYKIYRKRIKSDSLGLKSKYIVMQLWLTEFQVNINIKADKECQVDITDNEKNSTVYPGYWYGSTLPFIKLKDLKKEYQESRYGNLSFILEVIPDKSPIYYKSQNGISTKADFAIAAIYCSEAKIGNEPDIQQISTNIHSGQPVFLTTSNIIDSMNLRNPNLSEFVDNNAELLLNQTIKDKNFIWDKPYYFKLFFNNLGTWRSGIFNQNKFYDQVSYKFLMPIFVVGTWDIIAPQEVLPEWNPPKPYIKKLTLKSFLPFGDLGFGGKILSFVILLVLILLGIKLFFPSISMIIKKITKI